MNSTEKVKTLEQQCETILCIMKLLDEFLNETDKDSPTYKLNQYLKEITDVNDPLFFFFDNLKIASKTLDKMYIMKRSQLLNQN